jgi:transposase
MKFIQGNDRNQSVLFTDCLDQIVDIDNEVRIIDLFVEAIDLKDYSFYIKDSTEGRPQYNPKDLLKLFIYGYLNSIRSSRVLEKECKRNTEVMWLMKQLAPDHNTISNFRRDNQKAIRKVFRASVSMAKHFGLIGGTLLAGDSTKLRAQNSKKNNFNEGKIERHLEYIENKLKEYNQALEQADGDIALTSDIDSKIKTQEARKEGYHALSQQLKDTGETQISTSDPDSRQIMTRNNISEVAYSVQTTVDAKYCIPIDYKVTNQNDAKGMYPMLRRAKVILQSSDFTAIYDKGYHTSSEIKKGIELGVNLLVAIPEVASNAPDKAYNVSNFIYNHELDLFTCPEGQDLTTNGKWYTRFRSKKSSTKVKHYKTAACLSCPAFAQCTENKKGRCLERSEYAEYVEQNKRNIEANYETYKRRQAIVEHPYGIIKRQWGFYYIMTKKGLKRASADVGFMFSAFNLRRIFNIVDKNLLRDYLRSLGFVFYYNSTSKRPFYSSATSFNSAQSFTYFNLFTNKISLNQLKSS